jgi:hypothetical protein
LRSASKPFWHPCQNERGLGLVHHGGRGEEIIWKSGLSNGSNGFIGYSPRLGRGAGVLSNFIWRPIDSGTINIGMKMIKPDFRNAGFTPLYLRA